MILARIREIRNGKVRSAAGRIFLMGKCPAAFVLNRHGRVYE